MPPRSRSRICRAISSTASMFVFVIVSSSRALPFADELAGIDVDRDERLGLIDDEITARFQPDARLERLVDLFLHAVLIEDRLFARVKLDAIDHPRLHAIDELDGAEIFLFAVDADRREIIRELIAKKTLNEIEILVNHRGRLLLSRSSSSMSGHVRTRYFASCRRSSSEIPMPAVRTINPPTEHPRPA